MNKKVLNYNKMQALRNIYTVKNNRITIDLPESFKYSSVEIIILPIEKSNKPLEENRLSKKERLEQSTQKIYP